MDNPTYVRISGNLIYKGLIYPVREHLIDSKIWVIEGTNFEFLKSDCEVVALPHLNWQELSYKKTIEKAQEVLAQYLVPDSGVNEVDAIMRLLGILDNQELVKKMREPAKTSAEIARIDELAEANASTYYTNEDKSRAFKKGYIAGYLKAKDESAAAFDNGFKQGQKAAKADKPVLEEGQHLISTEQLQTIYQVQQQVNTTQSHSLIEKLQAWFPKVFQSEKIYKVGDRFRYSTFPNANYELVLVKGNKVGLLVDDQSFWIGADKELTEVENPNAITEEEAWIIFGDKFERFTLLPDTTDSMV